MQVQTIHAHSSGELERSLVERVDNAAFSPTLAVVFAGDHLLDRDILTCFKTRGIAVFGSSSEEEIADSELERNSVAAMLFAIAPAHFATRVHEPADAHTQAASLVDWAYATFDQPAVLLLVGGAALTLDLDAFLSSVFERAPGLPLYGGVASGDLTKDPTTAPPFFTADAFYHDGLYALAFDNTMIELHGVALSGWREVGTPKKITRSSGHHVFEIEGMPAADFYRRYFQIDFFDPEQILAASEYPIRLIRSDGTRSIRTVASFDPATEAVIFGGPIPEGSSVRFCSPNISETIQHTVGELRTFRQSTDQQGADAVMLFDCAIRSRSFGPYMKRELQVIKDLWRAPLLGFSSWGEIGNAPGEACNFHNTVISTVLIRHRASAGFTGADNYSAKELEDSVEGFVRHAEVDALQEEIRQLRKQKSMLSHFLHLTTEDVEKEREKSEDLLHNILPESIAERLKSGAGTIADRVDDVTILFADIVGFTELSSSMAPDALVRRLNRLFSRFDELCNEHGAEKIKTIGDAYMVVAGLPKARQDHAEIALAVARGMLEIVRQFNADYATQLDVRIGMNSGPVVAGVIGKRKFSYDLWGDAVNVASRMESNGIPGRIQVSESTRSLLDGQAGFEERGPLRVKGKGRINAYLTYERANR